MVYFFFFTTLLLFLNFSLKYKQDIKSHWSKPQKAHCGKNYLVQRAQTKDRLVTQVLISG